MAATKGIFIVGAKRTPFGAFGGKFKSISATELAVLSSKAAISESGLAPELFDTVAFGNVAQTSVDAPYLSRHVALKSKLPIETPAVTVNRLCGSGFEAVVQVAEQIELGRARAALCGGTENMSQAPLVAKGHEARFGVALGSGLKLHDTLWDCLTDSYVGLPMGITAENLAKKYQITRQDTDSYALSSQARWKAAKAAGRFDKEIAPVELDGRKGKELFATDEHPRPETTLESLQKLKPVFAKDGVTTAGSASGISDGAASLVVVGEEYLKKYNLTPLARLVSWKSVGCDPSIMGIGPVTAIQGALKSAGLTLNNIDLVEINEAFAAQYLACEKALGLDRSKTNTNGGAIALGHPLGASGARITSHLVHELHRTQGKYAVGSACIGGGQGIAIVLEKC